MLGYAKKSLDRFAIYLATKSLPEARPDPDQRKATEKLLQNLASLRPHAVVPDLSFVDDINFTFRSSIQSASPRNDLVHGKFFRAEGDWKHRPMVLLVHGWNAELHYKLICPWLARALNRGALNAALLELPYHLHRRPQRGEPISDFICDNLPGMLGATRQALADIHALLRWAKAQGCPTTALWGFSLGAWLAGLHLCLSPLEDAAVLTTPISDLSRAVADLPFCFPIRAALEIAPVPLASLNLQSLTPGISPESILVTEGKYDLFVPHATYEQLARSWRLQEWQCVRESHISVLAARRVMKGNIDWLGRRLKIEPG